MRREDIHIDVISGAKAKRPELSVVRRIVREGDELVITRLDRLSRSLRDLIEIGDELRSKGVNLRVLEQGIDTSTMEGRMMFGMLGVLAEFQRELIIANTRDGLAAARARGRVGGRKPKLTPRQARLVREMYDEVGGDGKRLHTVKQIADAVQISRSTVYDYLRKDGDPKA